jgi:hypothetical protein
MSRNFHLLLLLSSIFVCWSNNLIPHLSTFQPTVHVVLFVFVAFVAWWRYDDMIVFADANNIIGIGFGGKSTSAV